MKQKIKIPTKTNKLLSQLVLILIIHSSLLIINSFATIRYVSKTGSSTPPYITWGTASDSIQKCINICVDGDTIVVANGRYKETLLINKAIYLLGSSMDSCIIDGTGLNGYPDPTKTIYVQSSSTISNFNIKGKGYGAQSLIIFLDQETSNVLFCKVENGGEGIETLDASAIIKNNIIRNIVLGIGGGYFNSYKTAEISDNYILITHPDGYGIFGSNGMNFVITRNIIISENSNSKYGIYFDHIMNAVITNNLISGFSFWANYEGTYKDTLIYIANNIFTRYKDYSYGSVVIYDWFRTKFINNILFDNIIGIRCYSGPPTYDYNLFYKNVVNAMSVILGPNTVYADPMFIKEAAVTSSNLYDFHLQQYSPAIDKGDTSITDVDNSRSDIGMYGGPLGERYEYKDLPPKVPKNFEVKVISDSNKIRIKWDKNTESDFSHYTVYKGYNQGFIADSTTKYKELDSSKMEDSYKPSHKKLYYRISSTDKQQNESQPSSQIEVTTTGVENGGVKIIREYELEQNYPNPFAIKGGSAKTTIAYTIKERGYVKLMVYDIKGELITTLVNKEEEAGYYEVKLDGKLLKEGGEKTKTNIKEDDIASGIYLYRIEVIGEDGIPKYIDMKKMMYLK